MSTFMTTLNPTIWGYWNADPAFQVDADKIVTYVFRSLGEDVLSVELTKKQVWKCFEEATLAFNAFMIEYQAKSNLTSLLGSPTGSWNSQTGYSTINLQNTYVRPTLEFLVRQAEPYAAEVGYGGVQDTYSGSITLTMGKQDYDIYTELKNDAGQPIASLMPSGSAGKLKIHEVFHQAPIQYVFNSNLASNFVAQGLPVESYIPDTRFYVLPLFEDVLRAGMLEAAQRVRRSHYSYKISGRHIRLYPVPSNLIPGYNDKLWIRVGYPQSSLLNYELNDSGSLVYNSSSAGGSSTGIPDGTIFGASNPANIPYGLIDYKSLNPWARNWIFQYTLARSTHLLGLIRGKIKSPLPVPGGEVTLNGQELVDEAKETIKDLTVGDNGIKTKLDALSYDKLQEMETNKAKLLMEQMVLLPISPLFCIKMG